MADIRPSTEQPRPSIGERTESYRQWRARLAETQEDRRRDLEEDTGPTVNPMWSPQALFSPTPDEPGSPSRPAPAPPPDIVIDLSSTSPGSAAGQEGDTGTLRSSSDASRQLATELVHLNRLRVEGDISDDEFNARKAALFVADDGSARSQGSGRPLS